MDWLGLAKTLPTGQKRRIDCECGDGKTLVVNHFPKKYSAYCFRCGFDPYHMKGQQTLEELAKLRALNEAASTFIDTKVELPDDYTQEIPLRGRLWLYSAGLTPSRWSKYGIGYSPSMQRVVLPVFDASRNLVWYQMRAIHEGQEPKYLQPDRDRGTIMFAVRHTPRNLQRAVVVEDILSAIRVGEHIDTYSLLGTKITTEQASLLGQYEHITTWLDDDTAGRKGAYNIRKALSLVTGVDNIRTSRDPKRLSKQEIIEQL